MIPAKDIIKEIERYAPTVYQESYDNAGIQVGRPETGIAGILLTLDVTEDIITETIARGCNMIVAHHPLIFSGLKRLAGRTYVERCVEMALKNDIVIYAAHTNLDNMYSGVNAKIAEKLGLQHLSLLAPTPHTLYKLYTYAPLEAADAVRDALFAAGAGNIGNYSECSFNAQGTGTFRPGQLAVPYTGNAGGEREVAQEVKIEVLVPRDKEYAVLQALRTSHPYEEVAYEMVQLQNSNQQIGAGMVGYLEKEMEEIEFLQLLKTTMKAGCVKHTSLPGKKIKKVAVCGGSGSFLLKNAIQAGADIFITSDYKYHQFFDADGQIIIADIGHFESEQFTVEIFESILKKKFPNFAILLSNLSTNPVKYF